MYNLCGAASVSEFVRRNPDAESQLFSVVVRKSADVHQRLLFSQFVRKSADIHQRQFFSEFVRKSADVVSVSFLVSLSAKVRTWTSAF